MILKNSEIFRGMSYGDYLREWLIWLHSDSPIYRGHRHEICYAHGNLDFIYDRETGRRKQADLFQNGARSEKIFRGDVIFEDTPVFVPARSTFYSVGEVYYQDNRKLEGIADCQDPMQKRSARGRYFWCTIRKDGCDEVDLTGLLSYIETPSFEMRVAEKSPLRDYFEMPIKPGTYPTFSAGKSLDDKAFARGEISITLRRIWTREVFQRLRLRLYSQTRRN